MHTTYRLLSSFFIFFFNDTATTEIYTLSLHDALPIWMGDVLSLIEKAEQAVDEEKALELAEKIQKDEFTLDDSRAFSSRSEEHTSELQSPDHLVCRLLLEKKKKKQKTTILKKNTKTT